MSNIWQPPKQEPTNDSQHQPVVPTPTSGTEQMSFAKKYLSILIVAAIVIGFVPSLFGLFGQEHRTTGELIRDYANVAFIVFFLIIIFRTVSDRK